MMLRGRKGWWALGIGVLCVLLTTLVQPALAGEFIVIESFDNEEPRVVDGSIALLKQKYPLASTFKIFLGWVGLEEGVIRPETRIRCFDKHVPVCPGDIDLRTALLYSSNEYFVVLGKKIGKARIEAYLRRSGMFPEISKQWLKKGMGSIVHGGSLKLSPLQQHQFIRRIARGEICSAPVHKDLVQVLAWPSPALAIRLHGKTGSGGGVLWFNGFGWDGSKNRYVTVFRLGVTGDRNQVIQQFFSRFGCRYDPAVLYPPTTIQTGTVYSP